MMVWSSSSLRSGPGVELTNNSLYKLDFTSLSEGGWGGGRGDWARKEGRMDGLMDDVLVL